VALCQVSRPRIAVLAMGPHTCDSRRSPRTRAHRCRAGPDRYPAPLGADLGPAGHAVDVRGDGLQVTESARDRAHSRLAPLHQRAMQQDMGLPSPPPRKRTSSRVLVVPFHPQRAGHGWHRPAPCRRRAPVRGGRAQHQTPGLREDAGEVPRDRHPAGRARTMAVRLELTAQARAPTIRFGEVLFVAVHPISLAPAPSDQSAAIPSISAPNPGTLPIGLRDPSELIWNSKTVPPPAPASA
jgi:hypothetical protein